jgi:succinyl-CoA synthetase alpha subunit
MALFFDRVPVVAVQGITGREASMVVRHMQAYGTRVAAGVTPGKGGVRVDGVPVFDTLAQAASALGLQQFDVSVVYVPPLAALDAVAEAVECGVRFVVVIAENIPIHDAIKLVDLARRNRVTLIGPNSVGIISPGLRLKLGPIGGDRPERVFVPGRVGIISRSGGMTSEMGLQLRRAGLGVSTAVSVGGDAILGTTPAEVLARFQEDAETDAVLMFGEPGTDFEEEVAHLLREGGFTKPLVVHVAGRFTEQMPEGTVFGHAGSIIEMGRGKPSAKMQALRRAGAHVAERFDDMVRLLMVALGKEEKIAAAGES